LTGPSIRFKQQSLHMCIDNILSPVPTIRNEYPQPASESKNINQET